MKPQHSLIFLTAVLGLLSLLILVFPKDGLQINEDFSLKFVSFSEIFFNEQKTKVDISKIVENTKVDDSTNVKSSDSTNLSQENKAILIDSVIRHIEFPNNDKTILHSFFKHLANLRKSKELIRILHYGDSQIEGDRMTSYFRFMLQNQFGGQGAGLLPAMPPNNISGSMVQKFAGQFWKRYTSFGKTDSTVKHRKYGALMSFSRFSPIKNFNKTDSAKKNNFSIDSTIFELDYQGTLTFSPASYAFAACRNYQQCRMFYAYNQRDARVSVFDGEKLLFSDSLKTNNSLQVKKWDFSYVPQELNFKFEGKDSPNLYGFAFDGGQGIAVDNIPLRGSSGTNFTGIDFNLLTKMFHELNVKMLFLQFGENVVPYVTEDYSFYEKGFYEQLAALKRNFPDLSIIVIGVCDMARKEKDQYESYPNIEKIRNALKNATFKANCAYWDTYEAMGGKNSMVSWVTANPPLAEKDFTHFSHLGAKLIAKMFYNAFIFEYNEFLRKNN